MDDLSLSVIVPVYNVEDFLPMCMESLQSQTCKAEEIILVDDGSTDSSARLCDNYALQYANVKCIHKANGGLSSARNAGIEASVGDVLAFVDSDDTVAPTMFEQLLGDLRKYNADFSACKFNRIDSLGNVISSTEDLAARKTVKVFHGSEVLSLFHADFSAWNKLYKRHLFDTIRFPEGKLYEDARTTYRVAFVAQTATYNSSRLYNYRDRQQSIMNTFSTRNYLDRVNVWNEIYAFVQDKFTQEELQKVLMRKHKLVLELMKTIFIHRTWLDNRFLLRQLAKELNGWSVWQPGYSWKEKLVGWLSRTL